MDRTIEIEELLGEAGWLRRLAASLVGDGAQADDLVQDTWVAALRRPPRADGEPRPWLARVARNLAGNARRDRARREEREGTPRVEPPQPDPGSLAQEAEAQRLLAEAVTRLPEPLRAVIVLRYFQGLDSSAVAARLSLPASTVRTRLQRAIEELRTDLDRRCEGGRKAWGLLLVPLLRNSSSVAVVSASWPLWIAGASAACALVVVGARTLAPEGVRGESAAPAVVAVEDVPMQESVPLSSDTRAGSERVAGSRPGSAFAEALAAGVVSGIVLVDGRPPEWPINLFLLPSELPAPSVEGTMLERRPMLDILLQPEQHGAFSFEGLSPDWSGTLRFDGFRFADGGFSLALDAPLSGLVLDLRSGPEIVGRIVDPGGLPVGGLEGIYKLSTGMEDEESDDSLTTGFLCRADGAFRIPIQRQVEWGTVTILVESEGLGYLRRDSERFALATGLDLGELRLEPLRLLDFTVRDPAGSPIAGAFARVEGPGLVRRHPMTDAEGSGVLAVVRDRTVSVRFGAFAHRERVMSVEPGTRAEVVLEPLTVLDVSFDGSAARLRVSAESSAFVWDDDHWHECDTFFPEPDRARPHRWSIPAAPGQRFEYEFNASPTGQIQLLGLRPNLVITVEALDDRGGSLESRVVTLGAGKRVTLDLGENR